jgi:hypothetical protein
MCFHNGMEFPYVRNLLMALVDTSPDIWLLLLFGYPIVGLVLAWWLRKKGRLGENGFWTQITLLAPGSVLLVGVIITRPFESLLVNVSSFYLTIVVFVIAALGVIGVFVSLIHYFGVMVREVGRKNVLTGSLIITAGVVGSTLWVNQHDLKVWEEQIEDCARSTSTNGCNLYLALAGRPVKESNIVSTANRAKVHRMDLNNPGSLPGNLCRLSGLDEIHIRLDSEKSPIWTGSFDCVTVLNLETQYLDFSWIPRNQNLKRLKMKLTLDIDKYPFDLLPQINFSRFPNLESLSIEYGIKSPRSDWRQIMSQVPTSLKSLTKLRELSLSFTSLQIKTSVSELLPLPSLETLSVNGGQLSGTVPGSLKLKKLSLKNVSNGTPIQLDFFPELEELSVAGPGVQLIAPAADTLPKLAHVEIDRANISSFPAEYVARPEMKYFVFNAQSGLLITNAEAIVEAITKRSPKSNFSFKAD